MKITFISDSHQKHEELDLEPTDILVHCGDYSNKGAAIELHYFIDWFADQDAKYKIFISGNHDFYAEKNWAKTKDIADRKDIIYLENEGVTIDNINFWGMPYSPQFNNWAFMPTDVIRQQAIDAIPLNTNVLITHSPAYGYLDAICPILKKFEKQKHVGCPLLAELIESKKLKDLVVMASGHIHESRGTGSEEAHALINAAVLDGNYQMAKSSGFSIELHELKQ